MYNIESLAINEKDELTVGGVSTSLLAREYGTPLYVFDENHIRKNMGDYISAINDFYQGFGMPLYASKAFCCKEIARIADSEGFGLDVVSGGELYTALSANFPADKIFMHGNNKSFSEINDAITAGIGRIVADSIDEVDSIDAIAKEKGIVQKILLRIKPGIEAHTHDFVKTGQNDSKFGVSLETGEAYDVVCETLKYKNVDLCGLHSHIGSQIFDEKPFVFAAELLVAFMAKVKDDFGFVLRELNLGGGFGVRYTDEDSPKPCYEYMKALLAGLNNALHKHGLQKPFVYVEPGRSIVAEAGITLYTAGAIKDIKNIRKYVSIDGGMADNPRYIMYGARYKALLCKNPFARPQEDITLAGKCCESGDILIENISLPRIKAGDIIAVLTTGAYNYSMASNYNRLPRPAVIMVKDGNARVIIKRESYEDLIRNDI